jgi:hypothetical protein
MQKRKLGKSNLEVSAVGLVCMGMSFGYLPPADKTEMIRSVKRSSSPPAAAGLNAKAVPSKKSAPATWSGSLPTKNTGTALLPPRR